MNDKPKTKLRWRLLRWGLIGLAGLVTLAAMLVTEENWRGKRAWEDYKRAAEARGERFDLASVVPPPVPDDQNFFCAPVFTNMQQGQISVTPYGNDGGPDVSLSKNVPEDKIGYIGGSGRTSVTDLKAWQAYYRNPTNLHTVIGFVMTSGVMAVETNQLNHPADQFPIASRSQSPAKDVLLALSKFDPAVDALRQASRRPYANVPLNYEDGFNSASTLLPILAELKKCTQLLQLRAVAELAEGQSEKVLADVKLLFYLNNSLRSSPFLISHLVRMAIVAYDLQPIWEGLAQHRWSDAQLKELEQILANEDFLADFEVAMQGEKMFAIQTFEQQRITRESKMIEERDGTNKTVTISYRLMPRAYFYQNELAFAQLHELFISPLVDLTNRIVAPAALRQAQAAMEAWKQHGFWPYQAQAVMVIPAISASVMKFAKIQSQVDLARVACALERYRLAHGNYPETLDAITPEFIAQLPHDIINGELLHYRQTADGQFVLYSVGWDEADDGGKIFLTKVGSVDQRKGDWVWQYPAK